MDQSNTIAMGQRTLSRIKRISLTASLAWRTDYLLLCWLDDGTVGQNWGDKLNPKMVSLLSKRRVVNSRRVFNILKRPVYYVIGSGLGAQLSEEAEIWGQGFNCFSDTVQVIPRHVHALRGPLSAEKLRKSGVRCSDIFGDPALLYPKFFNPSLEPKHKIGVIGHFSHRDLPFFSRDMGEDVLRIDITGDIEVVVSQIKSCRLIASSSLHGLIVADAYGVPAVWLAVADLPVGDGFKFLDHFAAVGRNLSKPFPVVDSTTIDEVVDEFSKYVRPKIPNLMQLLHACPFLHDSNLRLIEQV